MSWLFSQALVAEYSAGNCSGGEPSAPSSGNPTPQAYLPSAKTTDFSRPSRFGMTFAPLTEDHGAELLMWFLEASRARTSASPEVEKDSPENDPAYGRKWPASSMKYDHASRSWRTPQHSLLGGLDEFSETWPRWGLMRDGECWEQPMSVRPIYESESGLWPTPTVHGNHNRKEYATAGGDGLATAVKRQMFATPTARDSKSGVFSPAAKAARDAQTRGKPLNEQIGGSLNPTWVEWLMGWPLGWTDLKPWETDRFRNVQRRHGGF